MKSVQSLEPVEIVERAIHLLRRQPAFAWAIQAAGAVPLLLSVLFFIFDMDSGAYTPARCALESLLCASCFLWFNVCRARFATLLLGTLSAQDAPGWRQTLSPTQLALQSSKLFVFPVAILVIVPLASIVAFFRTAPLLSGPARMRRATHLASLWQRQNWFALLLLAMFAFVVFVNVLLLLVLLPQLIRIFTGAENEITRAGFLGSWIVPIFACALTWLALDPIYQAVYVVRCFLGTSRETGADLLTALRHLSVLFLMAVSLSAAPRERLAIKQLDTNIDRTLDQREYAWHLARAEKPEAPGLLNRAVQAIRQAFVEVGRAIKRFLDALFRRNQPDRPEESNGSPSRALEWTIPLILIALGALVALAIIRRSRAAKTATPATAPAPTRAVRLDDEQLTAADLPEDRWLELARECLAREDFRLALRALYLASLSYLGRRELLTIAASKSNSDYSRELRRRTRNDALVDTFTINMRAFERGWYGDHPVDMPQIDEFQRNLSGLRSYVDA